MTRVHVTASRSYDVTIGRGLLASVGQTAAGLWKGRTAAVVSDTHVAPLYLDQVKASLEGAGFQVHPFVFPAGEAFAQHQGHRLQLRERNLVAAAVPAFRGSDQHQFVGK